MERRCWTSSLTFRTTTLTGTINILEWCRENGNPPPIWEDREPGSVALIFRPVDVMEERQSKSSTSRSTSSVPEQYESIADKVLALLEGGPLAISDLSKKLGQSRVSGHLKTIMQQLVKDDSVELTIPDKLTSRLQKYRLGKRDKKKGE